MNGDAEFESTKAVLVFNHSLFTYFQETLLVYDQPSDQFFFLLSPFFPPSLPISNLFLHDAVRCLSSGFRLQMQNALKEKQICFLTVCLHARLQIKHEKDEG
jgi:hypothetical protein